MSSERQEAVAFAGGKHVARLIHKYLFSPQVIPSISSTSREITLEVSSSPQVVQNLTSHSPFLFDPTSRLLPAPHVSRLHGLLDLLHDELVLLHCGLELLPEVLHWGQLLLLLLSLFPNLLAVALLARPLDSGGSQTPAALPESTLLTLILVRPTGVCVVPLLVTPLIDAASAFRVAILLP